MVLSQFASAAGQALTSFHRDVEARAHGNGASIASIGMLNQQLRIYEGIFKDIVDISSHAINAQQRDINREFTPVVAAVMRVAYDYCENSSGESGRTEHRLNNSHAKRIQGLAVMPE